MSKIALMLANATFASQDVEISLDGAGRTERTNLLQELQDVSNTIRTRDTSDDRVARKSPAQKAAEERAKEIVDQIKALDERLADSTITIRVSGMPATRWSQIKQACPVGAKPTAIDKASGYSVEAAAQKALLESAVLVDGDKTEAITPTEWQSLWDSISAGDAESLILAVLTLNQAASAQGLARVKRASSETANSDEN